MNLIDELKDFSQLSSLKKLSEEFEKLASSFLYGGYVSVCDHTDKERYRIYIRTVEFYCHYEGNVAMDESWRKDWIVYHRNGRYVEGDMPYFPLMSFHAHASGYDITFENEELQLRSSALIRVYEVYDCANECFLVFRKTKDDKGNEISRFVKHTEGKRYNTQSTYLYNFLNGFKGDSVFWYDENIAFSKDRKGISIRSRQNVPQYEQDGIAKKCQPNNPKKFMLDERKWSFTRLDEIQITKV